MNRSAILDRVGTEVPDFVTHYYRRTRRPFLNLSDLTDDEAIEVMRELIDERRHGLQHRPFGRKYLDMRRATEDRLREMFVAAGGRPERSSPHYFVLGESPWFRGLATDMAELRIAVASLPEDQTTVTWADSFGVTLVTRDFGLNYRPRPYHGKLYRLSDIPALVARYGLYMVDADDYQGLAEGLPTTASEPFVEVQLWSDEPTRPFLGTDNSAGHDAR
jgi:hypothetical protein